uniref:Calmodulin-binding protein n=1 Tax=Leersia perrieri TaxID=77586 RepID=A0A0D9Y084_9ORYZ
MAPKRELILARRGSEKRLRVAVPGASAAAGGGGGTAIASPGTKLLRKIVLVMLFLLRMSEKVTVVESISQIGRMRLHNVHGVIIRKLETMQERMENMQEKMDGISHEVKQLKHLHYNHHAGQHLGLQPNQEYIATGSNTNLQLRFLNSPKLPIYTEKDITDESNEAIRIGIFEGENMIQDGPLSKVKVELVVLRGDFFKNGRVNWTEEEFNNHIAQGRNGRGFVLGGDCSVWLKNGESCFGRFRFKEGSSRTCTRMFIIGARVSKSENTGVRVQEALMKPVTVLDRRNEANEKRYPPNLDDEVFRLEEISKDGTYHKRLKRDKIFKVRDFLKAMNKNAKKLREEVLQMKRKTNSWNKMVGHARECCLRDQHELKAYKNEEENVMLFFNCVHQLVGAAFGGDYVVYDNFDSAQKTIRKRNVVVAQMLVNKLKERAHAELEEISSDYVLKNNIPEPVSSTSANAACPLNPFDHEMLHQAENLCNAGTFYSDVICGSTSNPHDYQDQAAMPLPDWQQNLQRMINSADTIDWSSFERIVLDGSPQAVSSVQHQIHQLDESMPSATLAWTVASQSHVQQGQEPSRSPFPGSGHNNNC